MRTRQLIFNLAVLVVLAAGFAGVVWLFSLAIRQGSTFLATSLAAFATVSAAVIVRYFERRRELESARRERLGSTYEQLRGVLAGHPMSQHKVTKTVAEFARKGLLYASPVVLKAFREWRDHLPSEGNTMRADALRYERFVKAMRRDLGVSNWMLDDGDLARAVLADFDEVFPEEDVVQARPPEYPEEEPRVARSSREMRPGR